MPLTRRDLLAAAALSAALAGPWARLARAATPEEAERFVSGIIDRLTELVRSDLSAETQAERFREIFVDTAAVDRIVRFVMGLAWRDMNEDQRARFERTFLDYVGRTYARLLLDYEGQTLEVTGSQDFGDKGVLVTAVVRGQGYEGTRSEWLVSDRGGDGPKLIDITAEGVSLLRTQRQEFAAMLDKRNGDVDEFIADLAQAG